MKENRSIELTGSERTEFIKKRWDAPIIEEKKIVTSDLSDFGSSERKELVNLLTAWREQGLPKDFYQDEVIPMMNRNSGYVFLTNSEYQTAMMNGNKLEMWHNCGNCGHEGFEEDCQINDGGCNECNEEKCENSELEELDYDNVSEEVEI